MRKFHVGVAHRRLRNVQKSVMQVRSSCFVYINLLLFFFLPYSLPSPSSLLKLSIVVHL